MASTKHKEFNIMPFLNSFHVISTLKKLLKSTYGQM